MKKILLPTDFSKNSWNAIYYALELFKTTECLFYLVHTYTPILYNPELSSTSRQDLELMDITRKNSQNRLKKTKEKILENIQITNTNSKQFHLSTPCNRKSKS